MSLLVPGHRGAWVEAERLSGSAIEIDRQLREGRPSCGWPGDPDLELTWDGPRTRWIVLRHCEDGVVRGLAWWSPEELESIPACLAQMRLDRPDRVPVEDRIDAHNDKMEKDAWARWRDSYGEMAEHVHKLVHDTTEPRNVFRQIPGRRQES